MNINNWIGYTFITIISTLFIYNILHLSISQPPHTSSPLTLPPTSLCYTFFLISRIKMDFTIFKSTVFCLFFTVCLISPIECQSLIPAVQDGFWYGPNPTAVDSVLVEAFFDPVCPDSRDSWPPLKDALKQYGSRVRLVVHTFPLPYHDNAFATSRALHITNNLNSSSTYHVLEAFFHHQERFYGKATFNKPKAAVIDHIVDFTAKALGPSYHSEIKAGFNDTKTDHATRVSFKYGCLRGVYGTPYFFVNGFPLPDAGSALNYTGWRNVIDPLVSQHGK